MPIKQKIFNSTKNQLKQLNTLRFRLYEEYDIQISASELIRDALDDFLKKNESNDNLVDYLKSKEYLK